MNCCTPTDYKTIFGEKTVERDVRRYRKNGLTGSARWLFQALTRDGVRGQSVLEVGGGIRSLQLDRRRLPGSGRSRSIKSRSGVGANRADTWHSAELRSGTDDATRFLPDASASGCPWRPPRPRVRHVRAIWRLFVARCGGGGLGGRALAFGFVDASTYRTAGHVPTNASLFTPPRRSGQRLPCRPAHHPAATTALAPVSTGTPPTPSAPTSVELPVVTTQQYVALSIVVAVVIAIVAGGIALALT